jgi:hypothetical protein
MGCTSGSKTSSIFPFIVYKCLQCETCETCATTRRLLVNGEYYLQDSVVVVPFGERRNAEKEDFGCLLSSLILVGKEVNVEERCD